MYILTGADGFIGKHFKSSLDGVVECDLENCLTFLDNFKSWDKIDMIIHQGALSSTTNKNLEMVYKYNIDFSIKLFEKAIEYGIPVKYASSASVYEWWMNPYAISKKVNEIQAPPNSVGMRFFNVWAEEGSRDDMLYEMLKQGTAKYITRHKRDWVHVLDVVRAIATLIPSNFTGIIDVGTGQMTSVLDLANAMGMGHLPIKEDTPNEPDELCANIEPLMELGWFPTVNILDTVIAKTVSV